MPRYFLHVLNGDGLTEDEEGLDLPDMEAAIEEAKQSIRFIVAEEARAGHLHLRGSIRIDSPLGERQCEVDFADAFEAQQPGEAS
ncbi:DUF6894 family protein [Allosphingosinicella indica]|uniref:DUF6894 domain-containing protein n=1 Tax=Allosphingosinicella indica TaxID=941907 RepID=A0A1X7FYL4_9SPHN|nr:hypothetical protein [Allosphingosinicella indica]SMF61224.1 hypothetical protein SAMN06295910_0206 [Allosphingosinicella indica]